MKNVLSRIIIDYSQKSDMVMNDLSQTVLNQLTNNENFPVTTPPLADFATLVNNFKLALDKCVTGDRLCIAEKNIIKKDLANMMRCLAQSIESLSAGNKAKLLSSGFLLVSEASSSGELKVPDTFVLAEGTLPGEIKARVSKVDKALSYIFQYTLEPPAETTVWKEIISSTKSVIIGNLPEGSRVYVRVMILGSRNRKVLTSVLNRIVT